jgi:hypothetical protein
MTTSWRKVVYLQRHLLKRCYSTTGSSLSSHPSAHRPRDGPFKLSSSTFSAQCFRFFSSDCETSTGDSRRAIPHEVSTTMVPVGHSTTILKAQMEQILNNPFWLIPKKGTGKYIENPLAFFILRVNNSYTSLRSISSIL